jgi:hypothetical protein
MYIYPLDVLDATGFHAPALIIDSRIAHWTGAVIVDLAGHVPV